MFDFRVSLSGLPNVNAILRKKKEKKCQIIWQLIRVAILFKVENCLRNKNFRYLFSALDILYQKKTNVAIMDKDAFVHYNNIWKTIQMDNYEREK